jgi:hypothetical protein
MGETGNVDEAFRFYGGTMQATQQARGLELPGVRREYGDYLPCQVSRPHPLRLARRCRAIPRNNTSIHA